MSTLPRPIEHDADFWIDEAIWGHRLYDEQTPWLILLEFLGILRSEAEKSSGLVEKGFNTLTYRPLQQLRLRNILFNNPHLAQISRQNLSDDRAWTEWCELMAKHSAGVKRDETPNFKYLRRRFQTFEDFAAVVGFLRSTAIEGGSNKRWSSKFVFPFGPSGLYEDLNVSEASVTNDRRFFGRTGELLYLMLCRSGQGSSLSAQLRARFLDKEGGYNRLLHVLQGDEQPAPNERGGAYLPYSELPEFKALADDWLAILGRALPEYDALPHLVVLTGLHLILYQLTRSRAVLGLTGRPRLVVEIVSPKRTVLRELSATSYDENNVQPRQAIEAFVRRVVETQEWREAVGSGDPREEARGVLRRHFDWPQSDDDDTKSLEPLELVDELVTRARVRHLQHVGKVHSAWGRAIGLASRRASRKVRYAPTDGLLKSLVVCCVEMRTPFKEFLQILYDRYGLVIGDQQAAEFIRTGQADQDAFSDNARRLEERLASLGLVRRLSDSCAYVENPFAKEAAGAPR